MKEREFNILIGGGVLPSDKELFFGPLQPDDGFIEFASDVQWAEVFDAVGLLGPDGIFPSKSRARQNGFSEIPEGYSERMIGKKRHTFFILKISTPQEINND